MRIREIVSSIFGRRSVLTAKPSGRGNYVPRLEALEERLAPSTVPFLAFGPDAGGGPHVAVYHTNGPLLFQSFVYDPTMSAGVRVALGELDGNAGTVELVTGPGPGGGPHIQVFSIDTATGAATLIASFLAFDPSHRGGVFVAVGNTDGVGNQEIIVGADAGGGPHVRIFNVAGAQVPGPLGSFFPFGITFRGGVRVAAGNIDGNPANGDELVAGAGPGGGPHVLVFRQDGSIFSSFFAFDVAFGGGVFVSAGNLTPTGVTTPGNDALMVSAGAGGGPHLVVATVNPADGAVTIAFSNFLSQPSFTPGLRVGFSQGQFFGTVGPAPLAEPVVFTIPSFVAAHGELFFVSISGISAYAAGFSGGFYVSV